MTWRNLTQYYKSIYFCLSQLTNCKKRKDQYNSKERLNKKERRYLKLPYVEFFSRHIDSKIKRIIRKLCKDKVRVNLVFLPYKIGSMFSTKDKIPSFLKFMLVYKFVCASGNACYLGEIDRHSPTTIKKHLKTDKTSHIYQHFSSNENGFNSCTDDYS